MPSLSKKTNKTPQLIAAEKPQMEHPRFAVPFRVVLDGRHYEGTEISLTEITAMGLADRQAVGPREATIEFPFSGFAVDVNAKLRLLEASTETGIMRFSFDDVLGSHRIPLQSVFNAYIAGELTHIPGLLGGKMANQTSLNSASTTRKTLVNSSLKFTMRALKAFFFGALGVGLAFFVANRVHDRLFVYKPATVSRIAADTVEMAAKKTGAIVVLNDKAGIGQPLFGILGDGNVVSSVNMPCDCVVVKKFVAMGGVAIEGEPVVALLPGTSPLFVSAEINPDTLVNLRSGAVASVTFEDGTITPATLLSVPSRATNSRQPETGLFITLQTERPLSVEQLGEAVSVQIDSFPAWWKNVFKTISSFWSVK